MPWSEWASAVFVRFSMLALVLWYPPMWAHFHTGIVHLWSISGNQQTNWPHGESFNMEKATLLTHKSPMSTLFELKGFPVCITDPITQTSCTTWGENYSIIHSYCINYWHLRHGPLLGDKVRMTVTKIHNSVNLHPDNSHYVCLQTKLGQENL